MTGPYYCNRAPSGWLGWSVWKRAAGGGDRFVCRAASEKMARRIVAALNAEQS